ncbi:hypothetical protein AAMO2058_001236300 [Amorphochlora amoebiformis]
MPNVDINLHSDKGLILMHLRILQMVTETLNRQMLSRDSSASFAEHLISHVQNLLWFASLSISELKENMVDYIRKRHVTPLKFTSTSGDDSVFQIDSKSFDARVSSPNFRTPQPTPRTIARDEKNLSIVAPTHSRSPPPKKKINEKKKNNKQASSHNYDKETSKKRDRSRNNSYSSLSLGTEFLSRHTHRARSATSFDTSVVPTGQDLRREEWQYSSQSLRRGREGHRRLSMGGGGGQNEMGRFQVKFNIGFKQSRNQVVKRKALIDLVTNHCNWILASSELPFRTMLNRFISDMKASGSIAQLSGDPWGKAHGVVGEADYDDIKKRTLREQLLQISEFVTTLAQTIWSMHETLKSQRKPEAIIFMWYRDVYRQPSVDLLEYWECTRKQASGMTPDLDKKHAKLTERLSPLCSILKSTKFCSNSLQNKIDSLLTLIRTVPLVVPRERKASADSLLSILAFSIMSAATPEVCAHVHFVADMVMLVHDDDALGELGCSVTSLICAAQYSSELESPGYTELIESLCEEIGILPSAEPSQVSDHMSSVSEPSRDWPNLSVVTPLGSMKISNENLNIEDEKSELRRGVEVERSRSWQADDSDLIAICQQAAKSVGQRSSANRCIFSARALARYLFLSKICTSAKDAIRLGRCLESHNIIRHYHERRNSNTSTTATKETQLDKKKTDEILTPTRKSFFRPRSKERLSSNQSDNAMTTFRFDVNTRMWEVVGRIGDLGKHAQTSKFQYSLQTLAAMWKKRKSLEGALTSPTSPPLAASSPDLMAALTAPSSPTERGRSKKNLQAKSARSLWRRSSDVSPSKSS